MIHDQGMSRKEITSFPHLLSEIIVRLPYLLGLYWKIEASAVLSPNLHSLNSFCGSSTELKLIPSRYIEREEEKNCVLNLCRWLVLLPHDRSVAAREDTNIPLCTLRHAFHFHPLKYKHSVCY